MEICLDCDKEMYVDTETSEFVCQSCGKAEVIMGESFGKAQNWCPIPPPQNLQYLRKVLEKFKILSAVNITIKNGREEYDPARYRFLGGVIKDFVDGGKSPNYVSFLHDYFQAVSSDAWPRKEEILKLLSPHLPKTNETRRRAKARFHKWWGETKPR